MKCTSFFGHKWTEWERHTGGPIKKDDGKFYRQELQARDCKKCGYEQIDWLPMQTESAPEDETNQTAE